MLLAAVAAVLLVRVVVRIVNEALLFEEVFAAGFAGLVDLPVVLLAPGEGVVLDVDLALRCRLLELVSAAAQSVLLQHVHEAQ